MFHLRLLALLLALLPFHYSSSLEDDVLVQEVFELYAPKSDITEEIVLELASPNVLSLQGELSKDLPESQYNFDLTLDQVGQTFEDVTHDAFLAIQKGHYEAADILYRKALKLDPENADILFAIGYTNQKLGKNQIAKKFYREVLQNDQYYVRAFKNFFTIISTEDPVHAITKLQEMAKVNPFHPVIIAELSHVYHRVGNSQLALKYILKALELEPHNGEHHCDAGILYEEMKDYETAKYYYSESLKRLRPDSECDREAVKEKILYLKHNL